MRLILALVVILFLSSLAFAQESARDLTRPGEFSKYLTRGQTDTWAFDGVKDETIVAHVETKEFDSTLGLSVTDAKKDKLLFEVDDPGTNSSFSIRLPQTGHYKPRVRAFKDEGGGNYSLRVQRYFARPLSLGKEVTGMFDREGQGHYYFNAARDQILTTELRGTSSNAWKIFDGKGSEMATWSGAPTIENDGEYLYLISGRPAASYRLIVSEAQRRDLTPGKNFEGRLPQEMVAVWNFTGKPGDFRLLEIEKKGEVSARVIYAELDKLREQRLASADDWQELRMLPAANSGGRLRFAMVLGREGRYQLQLAAGAAVSYKVMMTDPSTPIERGQAASANLPVGGTAFYSFKAVPGQLIQAVLATQKFVPLLQLYDGRGNPISRSEANSDELQSRINHMVTQEGTYYLQVSSVGDGGGGEFQLQLAEVAIKEIAVGGRGQGTVGANSTDFWAFNGKAGQTVLINARSPSGSPSVSLRSPDGVELQTDDRGNDDAGSLLALKLPKTGRYTISITGLHGARPYALRLIDGD